jgi:serine/threonine protein kinase/Tol biopolymer transport system component
MPLLPGAHLGPYEITAPLGTGGMGEVYRARDTRLDRSVAVKILPAKFSSDPVRKQRFEREAKTISGLNHPHICVLYDVGSQDGVDYLVMECVEGETLANRLENGAMSLEQVLRYGAQIAGALDKAHRSGVVHRDLKPGNIMLTASGAKLLDFGLAKPAGPLVGGMTLTAVATQASPVTADGTIVGTIQYMSPEQIEGKEVDGRSDIFSLGAVLYEMLTGQKAFQGKSQLSVASAILEKEPAPISSIKPMTPPTLDHSIRRCLVKDPEDRWQAARDLALELNWIGESGSQSGAPAPAPEMAKRKTRERVIWLGVILFLLAGETLAVIYGVLHLGRSPEQMQVLRTSILSPEKTRFAPVGVSGGPAAISPDGKMLVIPARAESGEELLWIRSLDSLTARPLQGTQDASYPFWSADSRFIGFFAEDKLKKVEASGGPVQPLCDAVEGRGGTWNKEGVIIFTPSPGAPLFRVHDSGGTPTAVTKLDQSQAETSHRWPYFLPDGRHFLYFARGSTSGVYVGSLESQQTKLILPSEAQAIYSQAGGHLVWWREGYLLAQPFDATRMKLLDRATQVADHVLFSEVQSVAIFSLSQNGILVLQNGGTLNADQLSWIDRSGKPAGSVPVEQTNLAHVRISPDGQKIALTVGDPVGFNKEDIWLFDLARGVRTRFTFSQSGRDAVWSPDGSRVAYSSTTPAGTGLFVKSATSASKEELLLDSAEMKRPWSWSGDGRFLAYMRHDAQPMKDKFDIWILPLFGDRKPFPFLQSDYDNGTPSFSPNGRWIAYTSRESGAAEVYAASFPDGATKFQVSNHGGFSPVWRRDGKELFYLSMGGQLMAVGIADEGSSLRLATPESLFLMGFSLSRGGTPLSQRQPFDVSPKGDRFAVTSYATLEAQPLTLLMNWDAELKKK